jgi:hypothetical protein
VKFWVDAREGRLASIVAVVLSWAACASRGESTSSEASESAPRLTKLPSVTSAAIVEQVCRRFERCGEYQVLCPRGHCSYSVRPVAYEDCVRSGRDWSCVIERGGDAVRGCLEFALERPCVTEEELENHVAALNRGKSSLLPDHNQACRDLGELWRQCDAESQSPE